MTTITFGKYQGRTTDELKRLDSGYLAWGAQNLRSDKWRAEFAKAYASITIEDTAHEIAAQNPDIDYYEALQHARDEAADQARQEQEQREFQAREDAIIEKYLPVLGITLERGRNIVRSFWDWEDIPEHRFGSREKYEGFRAMMAEIDAIGKEEEVEEDKPLFSSLLSKSSRGEPVAPLENRLHEYRPNPNNPYGLSWRDL